MPVSASFPCGEATLGTHASGAEADRATHLSVLSKKPDSSSAPTSRLTKLSRSPRGAGCSCCCAAAPAARRRKSSALLATAGHAGVTEVVALAKDAGISPPTPLADAGGGIPDVLPPLPLGDDRVDCADDDAAAALAAASVPSGP